MCLAWPVAWSLGSRNVGGSQLVEKDGSNSRPLAGDPGRVTFPSALILTSERPPRLVTGL